MKKILSLVFCLLSFFMFSVSSCFLTAHAEVLQETDTVPSRNYTVVIDAGHGGLDVK